MTFSSQDKYLCLFGHPDDDVFIAGTMKLLLDNGAELHAAWLTSGDYFGLGSEARKGTCQGHGNTGARQIPCPPTAFPRSRLAREARRGRRRRG